MDNGLTEVFSDVEELAGMDLDVIVDFAGFGTTTAGAIRAVKPGGLVVLVGLGKTEWTMHSMDLVVRKVRLHGSTTAGNPAHLQGVIDLMTTGDLKIRAESLSFDEIPAGLGRLERGEVNGRLVAMLDDA
jgi:propanol-preferring alcohol dehydrogenase